MNAMNKGLATTRCRSSTTPSPLHSPHPSGSTNQHGPGKRDGRRLTAGKFLPAARFPQLEDPRALGTDAATVGLGEHACRWLVQRLLVKIKGAPVDTEQGARIQVDEGLHRFIRRGMYSFHNLRRLIGADGDGRHVKRPQSIANLLEAGEIAGVTAEVKATFLTQ